MSRHSNPLHNLKTLVESIPATMKAYTSVRACKSCLVVSPISDLNSEVASTHVWSLYEDSRSFSRRLINPNWPILRPGTALHTCSCRCCNNKMNRIARSAGSAQSREREGTRSSQLYKASRARNPRSGAARWGETGSGSAPATILHYKYPRVLLIVAWDEM